MSNLKDTACLEFSTLISSRSQYWKSKFKLVFTVSSPRTLSVCNITELKLRFSNISFMNQVPHARVLCCVLRRILKQQISLLNNDPK